MRFSKEMEQALKSLSYLDRQNRLVSAREVADRQNIPFEKLSKLLQKLAAAEVIEPHRGRQGGYSLNRPLSGISLMELHQILEESAKVVPCLTGEQCLSHRLCTILPGMGRFQQELDQLLNRYSVADFTGSLSVESIKKEMVHG